MHGSAYSKLPIFFLFIGLNSKVFLKNQLGNQTEIRQHKHGSTNTSLIIVQLQMESVLIWLQVNLSHFLTQKCL